MGIQVAATQDAGTAFHIRIDTDRFGKANFRQVTGEAAFVEVVQALHIVIVGPGDGVDITAIAVGTVDHTLGIAKTCIPGNIELIALPLKQFIRKDNSVIAPDTIIPKYLVEGGVLDGKQGFTPVVREERMPDISRIFIPSIDISLAEIEQIIVLLARLIPKGELNLVRLRNINIGVVVPPRRSIPHRFLDQATVRDGTGPGNLRNSLGSLKTFLRGDNTNPVAGRRKIRERFIPDGFIHRIAPFILRFGQPLAEHIVHIQFHIGTGDINIRNILGIKPGARKLHSQRIALQRQTIQHQFRVRPQVFQVDLPLATVKDERH